jgi:hypothetical protein
MRDPSALLMYPPAVPGEDRGGTVGFEAHHRGIVGADERADLLGHRGEDLGWGHRRTSPSSSES